MDDMMIDETGNAINFLPEEITTFQKIMKSVFCNSGHTYVITIKHLSDSNKLIIYRELLTSSKYAKCRFRGHKIKMVTSVHSDPCPSTEDE